MDQAARAQVDYIVLMDGAGPHDAPNPPGLVTAVVVRVHVIGDSLADGDAATAHLTAVGRKVGVRSFGRELIRPD